MAYLFLAHPTAVVRLRFWMAVPAAGPESIFVHRSDVAAVAAVDIPSRMNFGTLCDLAFDAPFPVGIPCEPDVLQLAEPWRGADVDARIACLQCT